MRVKFKHVSILLFIFIIGILSQLIISATGQHMINNFSNYTQSDTNENILIFNCNSEQVKVELCTSRTVRIQLSVTKDNGYRPDDPEYYMVQKNDWPTVKKTVTTEDNDIKVRTDDMELRIQKSPFRIGMYDLNGNLISKDSDNQGMYWDDTGIRGVKKTEGTQNVGGIFGFGSGDHGRRTNLNRYNTDFSEFTMSHGRVVAPFFMSTVGYGIFLNTIDSNTTFFRQGGGFQTKGYLDYYFMYGPDFKTILNEYSEITGRMELYGKWANGFMLSKYGNDNATQAEFLTWLHKLRDEGYPSDCYVFDYGWRGDIADNGGNQTGAGQKFGKQMWSNDKTKFPDIASMFAQADELGFHVGLHNNAGTPEASGGKELYKSDKNSIWVKSYMDSVIKTGYGDWFWPDEFDVLGSNTAPTFSSKGAYEAWHNYTDQSRPMFMTRGSYAGQHFATAWSGDINNTPEELGNQIGFGIDTGLIGYWATSNDLGGFMKRPTNELYTRWVSEFGAWSSIMRTHGHDGREPWTYNKTAQDTLKSNLDIRYKLYPYIYSLSWQGYSKGTPMMRAMLLEDNSQYNPDAWNLNKQYYFGDWFLVAPAQDTTDTSVSVWLPPKTTWYNYYSGKRYEGGENGRTIRVNAALNEIPVFVKSGSIVPMGPQINYADEKPLDPLTLDIYPKGTTSFTLYEDDGETREYITKNAYSETKYDCSLNGNDISFEIGDRKDYNEAEYQPASRSYNLKFNHINQVESVKLQNSELSSVDTISAYNNSKECYMIDSDKNIVYVKVKDTGEKMRILLKTGGIVEPALGEEAEEESLQTIENNGIFELENVNFLPVDGGQVIADTEWKGYTGTGFAKGFKKAGDAVEFSVNVKNTGNYDLALNVNCGIKNDARYDSSPRQGTLYLNNNNIGNLNFNITDVWGTTINGVKQGKWVKYTLQNIRLNSGKNTFRFCAEGDKNPGNYNIDSLTFIRTDKSVNAFECIEAESSAKLIDAKIAEDSSASNGKRIIAEKDGASAQYSRVSGSGKGNIQLRVKSSTGGKIIFYENGVGDKVLAIMNVSSDNTWHTITIDTKDTDAVESDIYVEFKSSSASTSEFNCELDWFRFTRGDVSKVYSNQGSGAVYPSTQIKLSTLTVDAEILYSIDNGLSYKTYTGPITVAKFPLKIMSYAKKAEYSDSEISTFTYTRKYKNGWVKNGDSQVYYKNDVIQRNTWLKQFDGTYWLNSKSSILKNCVIKIGKTYYAFNSSGKKYDNTQWASIKGKYYYVKGGKVVVNKLVNYKGNSYIVGETGVRQTGTKLVTLKKDTYILKKGKVLKEKWAKIKGEWYYAKKSGVIIKNKSVKISGKVYKFKKDGTCKNK